MDTMGWRSSWISLQEDPPKNSWVCFRKRFDLLSVGKNAIARIAAESKYWLWINGKMVVFEGGLNRGPSPQEGYFDKVDLAPFLKSGENTIAVLVWYWENQGRNNIDTGRMGFLFECGIGDVVIASGDDWKVLKHPAYGGTEPPHPSYLYAGYNVGFDSRLDLLGWESELFDDSSWPSARELGSPPSAPWNDLKERSIPLWRDHGLADYVGQNKDVRGDLDIYAMTLPSAAHISPYLKIRSEVDGSLVDIRTDRYSVNGGPGDHMNSYNSHRTQYTVRKGFQEFESLPWLFGEKVIYTFPKGVDVLELKYRETSYSSLPSGAFSCGDGMLNSLYRKSVRTLQVCMRENFMDCPDRERGQWIGDVSSQVPQVFYALDRSADLLVKKAISDFVLWRNGSVLRGNVPGACAGELPSQSLNAISDKGMIISYYLNTGDESIIYFSYPAVKEYLSLWEMDGRGLVVPRNGDWNWFDHLDHIDAPVLENCWYYLALKSALRMALITDHRDDLSFFQGRMDLIKVGFDRAFKKSTGYASGDFLDDRANAMAVLSGLAEPSFWPTITSVLENFRNSTPYMEGYVLEALFSMGEYGVALKRMRERYKPLVENENSTLWEDFSILGTRNHAWSGGPLTMLMRYIVGIDAVKPGYALFQVLPRTMGLSPIHARVPSAKGMIEIRIEEDETHFRMWMNVPSGAEAIVGVPRKNTEMSIQVNGQLVWRNNSLANTVAGVLEECSDPVHIKFKLTPGDWFFEAM